MTKTTMKKMRNNVPTYVLATIVVLQLLLLVEATEFSFQRDNQLFNFNISLSMNNNNIGVVHNDDSSVPPRTASKTDNFVLSSGSDSEPSSLPKNSKGIDFDMPWTALDFVNDLLIDQEKIEDIKQDDFEKLPKPTSDLFNKAFDQGITNSVVPESDDVVDEQELAPKVSQEHAKEHEFELSMPNVDDHEDVANVKGKSLRIEPLIATDFGMPGKRCRTNKDCGINENCYRGHCVPREPNHCRTNKDCGINENCYRGHCVPREPNHCRTNKDCRINQNCVHGFCVPRRLACRTNKDCPINKNCVHGFCVPRRLACRTNKDCPINQNCVHGFCASRSFANSLHEKSSKNAEFDLPMLTVDHHVDVVNDQGKSLRIEPLIATDFGMSGKRCRTNKDCPINQNCVNGFCVPRRLACRTNKDCPINQNCVNGFCVPRRLACRTNKDCPINQNCVNGFCVPRRSRSKSLQNKSKSSQRPNVVGYPGKYCRTNRDCRINENCEHGRCVPRCWHCRTNRDCKINENCEYGCCVLRRPNYNCRTNRDCRINEDCVNGYCVARPSNCRTNRDCRPNENCENGYCIARLAKRNESLLMVVNKELKSKIVKTVPNDYGRFCRTNNDCNKNENCYVGYCVPRVDNLCITNQDCLINEICQDGFCREKRLNDCRSDLDCAPNESCQNGECKNRYPVESCRSEMDCCALEHCQQGNCLPKRLRQCFDDQDCVMGRCYNGWCLNRYGTCKCDTDCRHFGTDYWCSTTGQCEPPISGYCRSDLDCKPNENCIEGQCKPRYDYPDCRSDSECCLQATCIQGNCFPRPLITCLNDIECDQSESCYNGVCLNRYGLCKCQSDCQLYGSNFVCFNGACKSKLN